MARSSRARKPRAQKTPEADYTWEVDGEVLRASDGWVEWGGELVLSMGETSGGAPYGLSLQEYQAIQVREAEREKRIQERRKRTWEQLTVDLGRLMEALAPHHPDLVWVLDLESGQAVCITDEEHREDPEEPWEDPGRFICIQTIEAHEGIEMRTDFLEDLPPGKPKTALARALRQRHSFRAFRETLQAYPEVREAWANYHEDCIRTLAVAWVQRELRGAKIRTT